MLGCKPAIVSKIPYSACIIIHQELLFTKLAPRLALRLGRVVGCEVPKEAAKVGIGHGRERVKMDEQDGIR